MKLKNKWKFLLFSGITIATIVPTISMISCTADDIKSIFDRIFNAIKAIQALGKGETVLDKNNVEIHNVIKFENLRDILFNSFGLTNEVFKNDVKNFDIIPKFEDDKNLITIIITLKEHASWPKEAIYSDLNLENPYHSDKAYFSIKDKTLSFDVSNVEFKNIAISNKSLSTANLEKSLNDSSIKLDNPENELDDVQKVKVFDTLLTIDNTFIPSSINLNETQVTYTKETSNILTRDDNSSSMDDTKYNFNFDIHSNDGFIIVDDNQTYTTQYQVNGVFVNIIYAILSDRDKQSIINVLKSYSKTLNETTTFDEVNKISNKIFNDLKSLNEIDLLNKHLIKIKPEFSSNHTNEYQDVAFKLFFTENILFQEFDFDTNKNDVQLETSKALGNVLVSTPMQTRIPKQTINVNLKEVLDLRSNLVSLFNECLKENKELVSKYDFDSWIIEALLSSPNVIDNSYSIVQTTFKNANIDYIDVVFRDFNESTDNEAFIDFYIFLSDEYFFNLDSNVDDSLARSIFNEKCLFFPDLNVTYK